ncbi:MAG TPA: hypothetical protein VIX91_05205 [Candidatus Acidoferrum sp.]
MDAEDAEDAETHGGLIVDMNRQVRLEVVLAVLGFAMAAFLFAYLEFTNYARLRPIMLFTSILVYPPSLLFVLLMDIEPHTGEAVIAWSVIAAKNSVLYATVGSIVARYLRKPTDSPQAKP